MQIWLYVLLVIMVQNHGNIHSRANRSKLLVQIVIHFSGRKSSLQHVSKGYYTLVELSHSLTAYATNILLVRNMPYFKLVTKYTTYFEYLSLSKADSEKSNCLEVLSILLINFIPFKQKKPIIIYLL